MARLFTVQLPSLQVAFSDLKRQASEQPFLLIGTPGSVTERIVNGRKFLYRQYYDASQKKSAEYIGALDDPAAIARADEVRTQIATANALLETTRVLTRSGYVRVDVRTDAILAALANNELFRAGAVLVGSHAYGALLNDLGARAAGYATEDIDIARDRALALSHPRPFAAMLADSALTLHPVPQLDRKRPSTSYKPPGADRLRVDLLVPTAGAAVKVLAAGDLQAHATGLPHLGYILEDPLDTVVLGRATVIPVKVPRPERLAWHKMLVSELRHHESDKKTKDVEQAAVLFAILAEREPGSVEAAFADLPRGTRAKTKAAAQRVLARLEASEHAQAAEMLRELIA